MPKFNLANHKILWKKSQALELGKELVKKNQIKIKCDALQFYSFGLESAPILSTLNSLNSVGFPCLIGGIDKASYAN